MILNPNVTDQPAKSMNRHRRYLVSNYLHSFNIEKSSVFKTLEIK